MKRHSTEPDISKWVRQMTNGFNRYMGVSCKDFEDYEEKILSLFVAIEVKWKKKGAKGYPLRSVD